MFATSSNPETKNIFLYNNYFKYNNRVNSIIEINLLYPKDSVLTWALSYSPTIEYKQIENSFGKIIKNWFADKKPVNSIDLILEKKFLPGLSRENYFLNTCFAIETYHRRCNFSDISFRNRLLDYKTDFKNILPENTDIEDFSDKIVKTRNLLVHQVQKDNIFVNLEIYYAAKYIEAVLKFNIYRNFEVPEVVILEQAKFLKNILPQAFSFNSLLDRKVKLLS